MNATFTSIAGAIESFAPTIATMLGGPLAGQGVSMLENVLGLTPGANTSLADRAAAVQKQLQTQALDGDQVVALKKLDAEHAEKMRQADIDLEKIRDDYQAHLVDQDVADRSSARLRETNVRDWTPKIIAGVTLVSCFALEAAVLFGYVPDHVDKVILGRILGTFDTATGMILAYYYGSSSGAARGQELLAQSMPTGAPIGITSK